MSFDRGVVARIALLTLAMTSALVFTSTSEAKAKKGTAPAAAADNTGLPPVTGKPLLLVSGMITKKNKDTGAQFDLAGLESLGTVKFKTSTPWTAAPIEFEGVPLKRIFEATGGKGTAVDLVALNDYSVEIPFEDSQKYEVIVATKRDGKPMPISDKGPLWVVYNFDGNKELKQKMYFSRSVWQLGKIVVK